MSATFAIGNQTSFAAPTPTFPFEYALKSDFDAFEFFPDRGPDGGGFAMEELSKEARLDLANLAVVHGVRLSVHAPWWVDPLRPGSHGLLEQVYRFASDLGAKVIVIHLHPEQGLGAFVRAVQPLLRSVARAGMTLAIENTVETPPRLFNELFDRLLEVAGEGAGSCGMCFDMGHANLQADFQNDYLGYLDALGPQVPIVHAHLHENWGDSDCHLPLFTGPAGLDGVGVAGLLRRLTERAFSGSLILEQWPDPPELLNMARDRLRSLASRFSSR